MGRLAWVSSVSDTIHNLIAIYTNTTKCLLLMQNLMSFLCDLRNQDVAFRTTDISENINLCSHG